MLDQLDDPVPFLPSPELVAAAKARGSRLRRRRRLGVTGAMIPVILVLAVLAGAVYVDHRLDQVQRVDVAAGVLTPVAAGAPYNVLVVGTDGPRTDGTDDGTRRADTIMVVHVDRSMPWLSVMSLPRDLVFDDGTRTTDRLDAVLAQGGPSALISSIRDHLGLEISHYVEIDFSGFRKLIDAAGGVTVQPTAPIRDLTTGVELDGTCQRLDGDQALAIARSRHVEYLDGGAWKPDQTGDLGRMDRQQDLLPPVLQGLKAASTDPATLSSLLDVFADNTTVDSGFDRSTILGLVSWGRTIDEAHLARVKVPVVPFTTADGQDVLKLDHVGPDVIREFDHPTYSTDPASPGGTVVLGDGYRSPVILRSC